LPPNTKELLVGRRETFPKMKASQEHKLYHTVDTQADNIQKMSTEESNSLEAWKLS
jgi:hypothetical protein